MNGIGGVSLEEWEELV